MAKYTAVNQDGEAITLSTDSATWFEVRAFSQGLMGESLMFVRPVSDDSVESIRLTHRGNDFNHGGSVMGKHVVHSKLKNGDWTPWGRL